MCLLININFMLLFSFCLLYFFNSHWVFKIYLAVFTSCVFFVVTGQYSTISMQAILLMVFLVMETGCLCMHSDVCHVCHSTGWQFIGNNHTEGWLGLRVDTHLTDWILPERFPSLVAQWLGIRLPMQGTQARALVQEDPTCRRANKPVHHNYWAREAQLLSLRATTTEPARLEPVLRNKRSHRNEKPEHCNEE